VQIKASQVIELGRSMRRENLPVSGKMCKSEVIHPEKRSVCVPKTLSVLMT
jgi:hypothetical protein